MKLLKSKTSPIKFLASLLIVVVLSLAISSGLNFKQGQNLCVSANVACSDKVKTINTVCGGAPYSTVNTSINFGCSSKGNPIADLIFSIVRFLTTGVGIIIVGSVVVGGVQYIGSRGDPQATGQAIARIRSSIVALIIFIFAYAILNYLIPIGFFNQ